PPGRTEARATYGRYGWWLGPCAVSDLPPPLPNAPPLPSEWGPAWQPAVHSLSRGLDHDPLHADSLGPKAHVPEEFLRFGVVPPGQAVQFRTAVWVPEARPAHLALGAPAHKAAWLNGTPLGESPPGYLWLAP